MTLALSQPGDDRFPPAGPRFRTFVGDVSPRRHMLPTLVGAHRLVCKARQEGAAVIVFDTTGLVDPAFGGEALKRAKIELLRPAAVVGIQRGSELEHLLVPLRRSRRTRVIDFPASRAARRREVPARQEHRATCFGRYFHGACSLEIEWQRLAVFPAPTFTPHRLVALEDIHGACSLEIEWQRLAVFPAPTFTPHRLVALEDSAGFMLALGIVTSCDLVRGVLTLYSPLSSLADVDALCLGDLALDPRSFRESRL
jgi:polynucleotide 5'-kinase involved in rRNA processing